MITAEVATARANFDAWWLEKIGFAPIPRICTASRAWYHDEDGDLLTRIRVLADHGVLNYAQAKNHGGDVIEGYREAVSRCSAQIVVHRGGLIEMDFDLYNPWDLVNLFRHAFKEVLKRKETDPVKVAEQLRKRGVLRV